MPGRTIIVGDIHGMLTELKALVAAVKLTKDDLLVLAGDVMDKGPDSAGVVQFLRDLRDQGYNIILVLGNHDEKNARFRMAFARAGEKGVKKMKGRDEMMAFTEALSPEDVAFLDSAVPYAEVPGGIVVHAGVLPTMEKLPTLDEYAEMSRGEQSKFHRILRVRHVTAKTDIKLTLEIGGLDHLDPEPEAGAPVTLRELMDAAGSDLDAVVVKKVVKPQGSFLSLGKEGPGDPFWADVYDGRFGHIYFGHSPYPDADVPVLFPHATGLDLGAVFGGHLAAVVLEDGEKDQAVVVEASGKFATSFWEE